VSDLIQLAESADLTWTEADLRRIKIRALDADGVQRGRWSLRNCLFGQCEFQRKQWVLSSGTWYSVAGTLVDEVNETFEHIERLDGLPEFAHATESAYCGAVAAADPAWALMDRNPIVFGGGRSSVEFCDLFSLNSQTLLHVKRYAGSAPLSHLFQQALVSGETFKTVADFRRLVNDKLPLAHRFGDCDQPPQGFRVALGIVRPGQFDLPFFSKLTLRNKVRLQTGFDFRVALAHIRVNDVWAQTAVARRRATP
jgi:uncharacterized protein (TIGR04141 family)